ncbi:hypothetical protein BD626DRAFT_569930 [Schizophyllum amplum]|uniref:Uncharacterized protein n=1 Tax=Schizophyllum amplum TaxID=97359 RepID=A0A550CBR5_9AGAR|nr:hypothetical protein BD626DRAFT_569930 [Auriculariopsis ampla]
MEQRNRLATFDDTVKSPKLDAQFVNTLKASPDEHPAAADVLRLQAQILRNSRWNVGSEV